MAVPQGEQEGPPKGAAWQALQVSWGRRFGRDWEDGAKTREWDFQGGAVSRAEWGCSCL